MYNPVTTYRIQFHKDFTFSHLEQVIPYLRDLGIKTIYASPIFSAVPGSMHGYDGIDPHSINPEIGTLDQLLAISWTLREAGIGWIQDIVPNHMAFHPGNRWLMDVLEKGPGSTYAGYFDILRDLASAGNRLMVPFLGTTLDEAIQDGSLEVTNIEGRLFFKYYENTFPLNDASVDVIKGHSGDAFSNTALINDDRDLLSSIAGMQYYRLCHWEETDKRINYRRFFTINGLICLNVHKKEVFADYHKLIAGLLEEGVFQGLRVDHIDGLYDPAAYLDQLRELAGENCYITVEKILQPDESLPSSWPVQGNTGYDFLAMTNNLFTFRESEKKLRKFYEQLIGDDTRVRQQYADKKALILEQHMGGELDNLTVLLSSSGIIEQELLDNIGGELIKKLIAAFLVHCPVYRYYGNTLPLSPAEEQSVHAVFRLIKDHNEELRTAAILLERSLLEKTKKGNEDFNRRTLHFYRRLMQFTGPLMAKGIEDTLMYTYNASIVHNEVGDSPDCFGLSAKEFHDKMNLRVQRWPLSGNATATHDTKRGEDARARLNVISEQPEEWIKQVEKWRDLNKALKQNGAPDDNDEYLIYQVLLSTYPIHGTDVRNYEERLKTYIEKALREAKTHSNWTLPDEKYEKATGDFALGLLNKEKPFWKSFEPFCKRIAEHGIVNSLSQLILKFTCPGVPDVYQGTELWDLSFVDPDNRREVNYDQRRDWLTGMVNNSFEPEKQLSILWNDRSAGRIKLWLTQTLASYRHEHRELFERGKYIPLEVKGAYKDHIIAFARQLKDTWVITAVPLFTWQINEKQKKRPDRINWKNTRIALPAEISGRDYLDMLMNTSGKSETELFLEDIFGTVPFALLRFEKTPQKRGAGILLHITSLPSSFGLGDLGPAAYEFADKLMQGGQKYWQVLPLNPSISEQAYSPYSSYSAMAGNPMLISPELLVEDGLLDRADLADLSIPVKATADFAAAGQIRNILFEKACDRFFERGVSPMYTPFLRFCEENDNWLHDVALYRTLKDRYDQKPWFLWPHEYKKRDQDSLERFAADHRRSLDKIKWLQFVFDTQWSRLKNYCSDRGIAIFGDMPFYVSHDSVDVWSHPEYFCLDQDGNMTGIAGVPPDYFSETGQLWGMPTYNWHAIARNNYKWWLDRLRRNLKLFDLLRIDHFRAFAEYWQIPAGEDTAINGEWLSGPGIAFFEAVKKSLGSLPFVAEDLGDNMAPVYKLRDEIGLPGMKVLQFAFGGSIVDRPHNHTENSIVYTGTHDNNTTVGWYRLELGKAERKRLEQYLGQKTSEKNIHLNLARVAYGSVAGICIIPMQDILGLDEATRMNAPGSVGRNWQWRLTGDELTEDILLRLSDWVRLYDR